MLRAELLFATTYGQKVTEAALFAIDLIQQKRMKGMTSDADINKLLDFKSGTINRWRKGGTITVDQIGDLIRSFDIDPKFLLKQEGSPWGEAELMLRMKAIEDRQDKMDLELKQLQIKAGKKSGKK